MSKQGAVTLGISDDDLKGLSEEERAALADTDEQEAATLAEIAGEGEEDDESEDDAKGKGDDEGEEETDEDGKDKSDAADKKAGAHDKDGAVADDAGGDDADADAQEPARFVAPRYEAPAVADYDDQIKALNAEHATLLEQYKAGEIEDDAFRAKQADIQGRRDDLLARKVKGDLSSEFNEQMGRQQWLAEVDFFIRSVKRDEKIDYHADPKLFKALDNAVKMLANDPDNKDQSADWYLAEAHEMVKSRFRLHAPQADDDGGKLGDKGKTEVGGKKAVPTRKPDLKVVPKTLGGLPAAGETETGEDAEFAHLEKLDGIELENAVAKMTPAQQERWARSV